jgi:uncharacterized membrane protein YeaQ/YmgE (transglycosylase-associated protein family)
MMRLYSLLLRILRRLVHLALKPIIKWSATGLLGGFLMGRIMGSRSRISSLLDMVVGLIGAHVARRLAHHYLGLYSEDTYPYIFGVGLGGAALLTLVMRLAIGHPEARWGK